MQSGINRNPSLLVAVSGLRFALFPIPVVTLFWKDEIGLLLVEIMWLQEALLSSIGGWLYSLAPRLPFWVQVPFAAAGLATIEAMREVKPVESGERISHVARAWHIVGHTLVRHARVAPR